MVAACGRILRAAQPIVDVRQPTQAVRRVDPSPVQGSTLPQLLCTSDVRQYSQTVPLLLLRGATVFVFLLFGTPALVRELLSHIRFQDVQNFLMIQVILRSYGNTQSSYCLSFKSTIHSPSQL